MQTHAHTLKSEASANVLATQRIHSIDIFRGLTILVMVFVNELAGVRGIPGWMKHAAADADTMTFVDVVFPAFLFIVGMSIPFSISARISKGEGVVPIVKHILVRTVGLLVLGVFLVNAEGGYNADAMLIPISAWTLLALLCAILIWNRYHDKKSVGRYLRILGAAGLVVLAFLYRGGDGTQGMTPQWWGILGLIGWAYLFSSLAYLLTKGSMPILLAIWGLCLLFFTLGGLDASGSNAVMAALSAQKGHATHSAIVVSGMLITLMVFGNLRTSPPKNRFIYVATFSVLCIAVGLWLRPFHSISKIYATPSWALFSVAACIVVFMFLYWVTDIRGVSNWAGFVRPAAINPLLTYILPYITIATMTLMGIKWPDVFREGVWGIVWSSLYSLMIVAFAGGLTRLNIKLQL